MERLFGLLDEEPDVKDRPDAVPLSAQRPRVSFEGVHFGYGPRREILHGVDFEIAPGGTVAVVGHSGSGKSTLARLLYRFYDVDSGRICIDGRDLREFTQASLRAAIGIVPQDTVLFNDTIYYNISYGRPHASREEVENAARAAHIHDFVVTLPDGYQTEVGERGLKLRVARSSASPSRALLKNPCILIFDEGVSSIRSRRKPSRPSSTASSQRTTLDRTGSTVMDADQILVMDGGRIVERSTHCAARADDFTRRCGGCSVGTFRSTACAKAAGVVTLPATGFPCCGTHQRVIPSPPCRVVREPRASGPSKPDPPYPVTHTDEEWRGHAGTARGAARAGTERPEAARCARNARAPSAAQVADRTCSSQAKFEWHRLAELLPARRRRDRERRRSQLRHDAR
jgi:ABC-type polar amino acid transport system ATPase subunit